MLTSFNGALVIREQNGRAFYEAKWRDSHGRQVKRRVGPAWADRDGSGRWRRRSGRVADGSYDEKSAIVKMRRLIDDHETKLAAGPHPDAVMFDQVAGDWLHHLEHVDGIKPSTLSSYRYILRPPGTSPRKRGRRKAGGRVLAEFGSQPIATITTPQVERWLARLDQQPISKRTVNIHRQIVCSVLEYAVRRPDQYGIEKNVARATSKRREPDPAVLDFYEPEEVAALARAARAGAHRDPSRPAISDAEREERRRADDQDAALFVVAAFTGLRMGELLELRWRYVSFERATVTVAASWTVAGSGRFRARGTSAQIISTGLTGGEVLLERLPNEQPFTESPFQQLKVGQWMMLCGPHPNSNKSDPRFVLNWYQIMSIDTEGTGLSINPLTQRVVTLRGAQWPWLPGGTFANSLCAGICRGAVAVHSKTLRLENPWGGEWGVGRSMMIPPNGAKPLPL